jgi:hypothetical protein
MPDECSGTLAHLLPPGQPVGPKGGRPRVGHRVVVRVIWFLLTAGARWEDIPAEFGGPGRTAHRRLRAWADAGAIRSAGGDQGRPDDARSGCQRLPTRPTGRGRDVGLRPFSVSRGPGSIRARPPPRRTRRGVGPASGGGRGRPMRRRFAPGLPRPGHGPLPSGPSAEARSWLARAEVKLEQAEDAAAPRGLVRLQPDWRDRLEVDPLHREAVATVWHSAFPADPFPPVPRGAPPFDRGDRPRRTPIPDSEGSRPAPFGGRRSTSSPIGGPARDFFSGRRETKPATPPHCSVEGADDRPVTRVEPMTAGRAGDGVAGVESARFHESRALGRQATPHRPGLFPADGLRAGGDDVLTADRARDRRPVPCH